MCSKTYLKCLPFDHNIFLNFIMSIFLFLNIMKDNQFISNQFKKKKYNKQTNYIKCINCNTKICNNKSTYYAFDHIWCYECWCNIKI